jgi:hypothetical protein
MGVPQTMPTGAVVASDADRRRPTKFRHPFVVICRRRISALIVTVSARFDATGKDGEDGRFSKIGRLRQGGLALSLQSLLAARSPGSAKVVR